MQIAKAWEKLSDLIIKSRYDEELKESLAQSRQSASLDTSTLFSNQACGRDPSTLLPITNMAFWLPPEKFGSKFSSISGAGSGCAPFSMSICAYDNTELFGTTSAAPEINSSDNNFLGSMESMHAKGRADISAFLAQYHTRRIANEEGTGSAAPASWEVQSVKAPEYNEPVRYSESGTVLLPTSSLGPSVKVIPRTTQQRSPGRATSQASKEAPRSARRKAPARATRATTQTSKVVPEQAATAQGDDQTQSQQQIESHGPGQPIATFINLTPLSRTLRSTNTGVVLNGNSLNDPSSAPTASHVHLPTTSNSLNISWESAPSQLAPAIQIALSKKTETNNRVSRAKHNTAKDKPKRSQKGKSPQAVIPETPAVQIGFSPPLHQPGPNSISISPNLSASMLPTPFSHTSMQHQRTGPASQTSVPAWSPVSQSSTTFPSMSQPDTVPTYRPVANLITPMFANSYPPPPPPPSEYNLRAPPTPPYREHSSLYPPFPSQYGLTPFVTTPPQAIAVPPASHTPAQLPPEMNHAVTPTQMQTSPNITSGISRQLHPFTHMQQQTAPLSGPAFNYRAWSTAVKEKISKMDMDITDIEHDLKRARRKELESAYKLKSIATRPQQHIWASATQKAIWNEQEKEARLERLHYARDIQAHEERLEAAMFRLERLNADLKIGESNFDPRTSAWPRLPPAQQGTYTSNGRHPNTS